MIVVPIWFLGETMATLTLKNIPEHLHARLKESAEKNRRSLNSEILKIIGRPGNPLTKDVEVEIDADYNLSYDNVIQAISACTGSWNPRTQSLTRYVEKIKFAPPKKKGNA